MTFYLGRYAELYDLLYQDKPYTQEAAFVHDQLCAFGEGAPQRILELACGTGTHAIELARRGAAVTALDCSVPMLEVAKRKVAEAGANVTLFLGDMTDLAVPDEPFDAVICLFDSIGYVGGDENIAKVLGGVRQSLKSGGLFLFEFWHAPTMLQCFKPLRVRRIDLDDRTIIRVSRTSLAPDRPIANVKYDIFELKRDNTYIRHSETHENRFFTVFEMERLATLHGFAPLAAYAGFDALAPITDATWHVVSLWRAIAQRISEVGYESG